VTELDFLGTGNFLAPPGRYWNSFVMDGSVLVEPCPTALPHLRAAGGGAVVIISSITGMRPAPRTTYAVAKAAEIQLAGAAAQELAPAGIRVNAVAPGIIDDELMAFITAGGPLLDDYLAQMPLGRVGTVEDVAAAVRYLIGPESSFVTGETLGVDGGHHLRRGADYSLLFGA